MLVNSPDVGHIVYIKGKIVHFSNMFSSCKVNLKLVGFHVQTTCFI